MHLVRTLKTLPLDGPVNARLQLLANDTLGGVQEMAYTITQTLSLDRNWDAMKKAWRCDAVRIPRSKVSRIFTENGERPRGDWEPRSKTGEIAWHGDVPKEITVELELSGQLSSQTWTRFWQAAAVLLPLIAGFATNYFNSPKEWHISGKLLSKRLPISAEPAYLMMQPPEQQRLPDGRFFASHVQIREGFKANLLVQYKGYEPFFKAIEPQTASFNEKTREITLPDIELISLPLTTDECSQKKYDPQIVPKELKAEVNR